MRYRRVALLLCLLLATCAKTGENNDVATVIVVTVRGVTSDLRVLRAQATLGGVPAASAETFLAAGPAQQFGLSLPPGSSGEYALSVDGITADGCAVSRGATSASIGGEVRIDLTVELSPLPAPDCASVPVACADEVKDGSETDVDCGGGQCPSCDVGRACAQGSDCLTGLCTAGACGAPPACRNGQKDNSETDVDCGGPTCGRCGVGKACGSNSDCDTGSCVAGVCGQAPFAVTGVSPAKGPTNATTALTITGSGFLAGMTVKLGNALATGVMVTGPTQIKAVAPTRAAPALVDVSAQLSGSGAASLGKAFRYHWGLVGLKAPIQRSTSGGTQGLALVDLNGDGALDLVTANFSGGNVTVFTGQGNGTFSMGTSYAAGAAPSRVATGDLNGDGKADVVISNFNGASVSVLLGNGDGTLRAKADYAVGTNPAGLVVADLTGDGKLDVAVASRGGTPQISVLTGKGDGTLQPKVDYAGGASAYLLAAADLDGDGKLDLVSGNDGNGYLSVLLNNGDGTFKARVDYALPFNAYSVTTGDLNGDGKADVLATANGGTQIAALLGKGDGTLQAAVATTIGAGVKAGSLADLDLDGTPDAVILTDGGVALCLGKGDGTFKAPVVVSGVTGGFDVATADLNGDGKLDVATANLATFRVLLGTAS